MISINITGNLGANAETVAIGERNHIKFRMCSTSKHGQQSDPTWVTVIYRENPNLLPFLTKGATVHVAGRPVFKVFTPNNGQPQTDITIWASDLQLIGTKQEQQTPAPAPLQKNNQLFAQQTEEDDLPF